ncbi:MAG TPA: heparan-alpha-glucosaminide N-acetyltransferase domain-containing protein [Methylomirabilota bacterium]|nr:heparan-alpha-glucosaminide N-acetyltransferase domain-containing protein [Methylomirabilota bacterium]
MEREALPASLRSQGAADLAEPAPVAPSQRLLSLDVFRGLTIAAMLLVNNPGTWEHVYPPLEHAAWHGWTPTDLVFPFFLFIVGVATALSLGRLLEAGASRSQVLRKAAVRAGIILVLGLTIQGFPHYNLPHLRLPGVLPRIAIAYLITAAIVMVTGIRGQVLSLVALLLGYWTLMTLVPVPGVGRGVLEPEKNLSNWIDFKLLGVNHVWQETGTWDPEGLLSTLGAVASVLCGVLAGHWIRSRRRTDAKAFGLFYAGSVTLLLGWTWSRVFPINKSLWTSSYVLLSAGIACLVLSVIFWLVDIEGYRAWTTPFLVFGTNAIAAYWLSTLCGIVLDWITLTGPGEGEEVVLKTYLYGTFYASWLSPANASLAYAVSYVVLWLGLISFLYRRRIFIRI